MQPKFNSPAQALASLGLSKDATIDEVKSSYHKLMSLYHPDANGGETEEKYYLIRDAYEYLVAEMMRPAPQPAPGRAVTSGTEAAEPAAYDPKRFETPRQPDPRPAKIIGNKSAMQAAKLKRRFAAEHAKQENRRRRRHEAEKQQRLKDETRYRENQAYEEAMMKIRAIRAAEIAANMYKELQRRNG